MEMARKIVLATPSGRESFKLRLPAHWTLSHTRISSLQQQARRAAITIVEPDRSMGLMRLRALAAALAAKGFTKTVGRRFLVWSIPEQMLADRDLILPFAEPDRVEIARDQSAVEAILRSLAAKCEALAEREGGTGPAPNTEHGLHRSPLDQIRTIVAATKDLRAAGGNLSAAKIAKLFGVSVSHLAQWLGRTRQAVSKTPDADSLQGELSHFERIARLRAVLEDPNDFRKWLRMANKELEGRTPLQLLDEGRWEVLADLVEDMLTGSPT